MGKETKIKGIPRASKREVVIEHHAHVPWTQVSKVEIVSPKNVDAGQSGQSGSGSDQPGDKSGEGSGKK